MTSKYCPAFMSNCSKRNSSVIRQKGESQNDGNENVRVRIRGNKFYFFSENLACFGFLLPPF